MSVRVAPRCVGQLNIQAVVLVLSPHTTITFLASTFPSSHTSLGDLAAQLSLPDPFSSPSPSSLLPAGSETRSRVVPCAWSLSLPHLGPLPALRILSPPVALVGEHSPAVVSILNAGRELRGGIMEFAVKLGAGLTAMDLGLSVRNEGRLSSLPLDGQGRISLPTVPAGGGSYLVHTWIRATRACKVTLTALLLCPSPIPCSVDLVFEEPFEYRCELSSEAGVHTLTPPRLDISESGVTPVTVGQQLLLSTLVRGAQQADLELCSAQLLINHEAGLASLADLSSQLLKWPAPLGCGDAHSLLFLTLPSRSSDQSVSMGQLKLLWRRQTSSSPGGGAEGRQRQPSLAIALAAAESDGPRPDPMVTTLLDLPKVSIGESLLTVRTIGPAALTAGIAFTYSLQIRNYSHHEVQLSVALEDSPGFVLSGERMQLITVAARESSTAIWLLVAHTAGTLALPTVRVLAPRLGSSLYTQGTQIHVLPF